MKARRFTLLACLALLLIGCGSKSPSSESEKALALISSNMTEDAVRLLEQRVQSAPDDKSAVFLLKVVRSEATSAELITMASEDRWVHGILEQTIRDTIATSAPAEVVFDSFTVNTIEGDADEAVLEAQTSPLDRFLAGYVADLTDWYLKSDETALQDPRRRFALYMRLGYGDSTGEPVAKLRGYSEGQSGDYVDLATWETAAWLYSSDKRAEALSMVQLLARTSTNKKLKSAVDEALATWRSVQIIEVPISEPGSGLELQPRRSTEVSARVPPGTEVEVQVLNSITTQAWGRELRAYPSDELKVIDVDGAQLDVWWEERRKHFILDEQKYPFPGTYHQLSSGERPTTVILCSSGELRFSSALPSPRSEDSWKLRLEYANPQSK